MNFKKTIQASMVAAALTAYSGNVEAKVSKPANIEMAAMGNTNVVVNNDFELFTNPALMEYRGSKFSFPGLNLKLNDPREMIAAVKRYKEFFNGLDSTADDQKASYMQSFIEKEDKQSVSAGLSLLPSLQLSTGIGTFGLAGYGFSDSKVIINPKSLAGLAEVQQEADRIKAGGMPEEKSFSVNKPVDLITVNDAGVALGYAKKFDIQKILDVSAGVTIRGFERFFMDFAPSANFSVVNGEISQEDLNNVKSKEDLEDLAKDQAPKLGESLNMKPTVVRGRGYALDAGLILSRDISFMDVMVGASMKNLVATVIKYDNGVSEKDKMQYGVGIASHPLKTVPVLDQLVIAAEVHGLESKRTLNAGASWRLGSTNLNFTPKVGVVSGEIDPRGDYVKTKIFTAGAVFDLVILKLAASYAIDDEKKQKFGLGLTFGYEWDK